MFNGVAQGRGGTAATVGFVSSALLWLAVVQVVFLQEFPGVLQPGMLKL